ncbi:hypothetical protein KSP40_PGU010682 [Platanthera guangdongensis]|uniref:Uncharacterized protein n=1 Tax=Platanthera guangdongensis TaxID=2320717 RepID=A0ABR2MVG4_9ASPA
MESLHCVIVVSLSSLSLLHHLHKCLYILREASTPCRTETAGQAGIDQILFSSSIKVFPASEHLLPSWFSILDREDCSPWIFIVCHCWSRWTICFPPDTAGQELFSLTDLSSRSALLSSSSKEESGSYKLIVGDDTGSKKTQIVKGKGKRENTILRLHKNSKEVRKC